MYKTRKADWRSSILSCIFSNRGGLSNKISVFQQYLLENNRENYSFSVFSKNYLWSTCFRFDWFRYNLNPNNLPRKTDSSSWFENHEVYWPGQSVCNLISRIQSLTMKFILPLNGLYKNLTEEDREY